MSRFRSTISTSASTSTSTGTGTGTIMLAITAAMIRPPPMKRMVMRMKPGKMQHFAHRTRNARFLLGVLRRGRLVPSRLGVVFPPHRRVVREDDGGGCGLGRPLAVCFPALDHCLGYVGEVDGDGRGEALDYDFAVDGRVHVGGDGGTDWVGVGDYGGDDGDEGFVGDIGAGFLVEEVVVAMG